MAVTRSALLVEPKRELEKEAFAGDQYLRRKIMKPNRFIIVLILTLRGPGGVAAASPALLAEMSDAERAFVQKQNARKEEIKKRYFSPDAKAKLQAEIAGRNAKASATPDTSIAKAKSTGVDTSVFGLPLGEPLRL